jgi:hypothetical protein
VILSAIAPEASSIENELYGPTFVTIPWISRTYSPVDSKKSEIILVAELQHQDI